MMRTNCLHTILDTILGYKISEKFSAILVLQKMFPVCNRNCALLAAGCLGYFVSKWRLMSLLTSLSRHCSLLAISRIWRQSTCLTSATSCSVDAHSRYIDTPVALNHNSSFVWLGEKKSSYKEEIPDKTEFRISIPFKL